MSTNLEFYHSSFYVPQEALTLQDPSARKTFIRPRLGSILEQFQESGPAGTIFGVPTLLLDSWAGDWGEQFSFSPSRDIIPNRIRGIGTFYSPFMVSNSTTDYFANKSSLSVLGEGLAGFLATMAFGFQTVSAIRPLGPSPDIVGHVPVIGAYHRTFIEAKATTRDDKVLAELIKANDQLLQCNAWRRGDPMFRQPLILLASVACFSQFPDVVRIFMTSFVVQ